MSSTDRGSQDVTFDFKHPLQGKEFNKLLRGIVKHGIYQGGAVSITSDGTVAPGTNNAITIQPFQTVFNSGTDKLVNVATSASLRLTCNDTSGPQSASDTLLVMRYVWDDVIQNYIDFEYQDETLYTPLDTDVVVCKIVYGEYPAISSLVTTGRTSGIFDDDYNLVVENTLYTDIIKERTLNAGINMGSSAFFVDQANKRIGVNNASPSYTLDVDGTGQITGAVILGSTLGVTGITTLGTANITDMNATGGHITTLDGAMDCDSQIMTNVNIDSGTGVFSTVSATTFTGDLTGVAQQFTCTTTTAASAEHYVVFVDGPETGQGGTTDVGFLYKPSTGTITADVFKGNVTGNVTGALTGNATTCTRPYSTVATTGTHYIVAADSASTDDDILYKRSNVYINASEHIYAVEFYRSSTRELKKDIERYEGSAVDFLDKVEICNYKMKKDSAPAIGFIAEDTDPMLSGDEQKNHCFGNHLGYLTKAIQELNLENKSLKKSIKELKKRIIN